MGFPPVCTLALILVTTFAAASVPSPPSASGIPIDGSARQRFGRCGPSETLLTEVAARYKNLSVVVTLQCRWEDAAAVAPLPPQCCCFFSHEPFVKKCLPHAIIVGAQKAGTTALFGHLLLRRDFERPKRKEVQYFGKRELPSLLWYLRHMPLHEPKKVRPTPATGVSQITHVV